MANQTIKPIPEVQSDIEFPDKTHYLKREWLDEGCALGIPKPAYYYVSRTDDGEVSGIFSEVARAFSHATRSEEVQTLVWAH